MRLEIVNIVLSSMAADFFAARDYMKLTTITEDECYPKMPQKQSYLCEMSNNWHDSSEYNKNQ